MACSFNHIKIVEFYETDMAGIVHFSNFFRYMESAERAFFYSFGLSVHAKKEGQTTGWPVLTSECQYQNPLRFEDRLEIQLLIEKITQKTVTYRFRFINQTTESPQLAATGLLRTVHVTCNSDHTMKGAPIPKEVLDKISEAPPKELEAFLKED